MPPNPEAMKEIVTRQATLADLETIRSLNQELCAKEHAEFDKTIDPNYPATEAGEAYFRSRLEQADSFAVIAEEDGVAVGYLVGALLEVEDYRTVKRSAEAENMFVKAEMRGRGVGRKLMQQFEDRCREKGVEVIRIVASSGNTDGIRFYESRGLKPVSVVLEKQL